MTHIPVNMATQELDSCPECRHLIYKSEGAWLDIWVNGPWFADTDTPHRHQPGQETATGTPETTAPS